MPLPGLVAALVLACLVLTPAAADESAGQRLQLEVLQMKSVSTARSRSSIDRPIEIQLRVTNRDEQAVVVPRAGLQLLCDNKACKARSDASKPEFSEQKELEPGQSVEGWISFQLVSPTVEEPKLTLACDIPRSRQSLDLNQILRDLVSVRLVHTGYEQRITVLTIRRSVDFLTVWVLTDQFRSLKKQGVQRLVLDVRPSGPVRIGSRIMSWLNLTNASAAANRRGTPRGYPPPVQFREFHVAGLPNRNSSPGQIVHRSRELAVAAAAASLYQRLSLEDAVLQFQSDEAGIRRAALEASIDQLPEQELAEVLGTIAGGHGSDRRMLLELLDRVTSPAGVETLRTTLMTSLTTPPTRSDSFAPETTAVAARTLVRCVVPGTEDALRQVWETADGNRTVRETMISEVLKTQDHRWTSLVSEYATLELDSISASLNTDSQRPQRSGRISRILRDSLRFLHGNSVAFTHVARRRLLDVTVPEVQDELLRIVIDTGDESLARECVTQRLQQESITRQMLGMIHELPDSRWTMQLFDLTVSKKSSRSDRASTLTAALRCATDAQLDEIIDRIDDVDPVLRQNLYQPLAAMHHPRCAELLAKALQGNETEISSALRCLPASESPEMLQLVIDRFESFRQLAIEQGSLTGQDFRTARHLLVQLGPVDHPEARRMINRSLISPDPGLRSEALHQLAASHNRSRTRTSRQEAEVRELKREGRYDEAMKRIDELIERDPLCADFRMTRAALRMRANQISEAQQDVREADRLSPGDVFTESTLALLKVRSGQYETGLSDAESVMIQVPASASMYYDGTLYNTACVYARALELPNLTSQEKQQFAERAVQLMHQAADAGFHDENHVLQDPDLVTLHEHVEWPAVMEKITANTPRKR